MLRTRNDSSNNIPAETMTLQLTSGLGSKCSKPKSTWDELSRVNTQLPRKWPLYTLHYILPQKSQINVLIFFSFISTPEILKLCSIPPKLHTFLYIVFDFSFCFSWRKFPFLFQMWFNVQLQCARQQCSFRGCVSRHSQIHRSAL
jgi:hypothetical protein